MTEKHGRFYYWDIKNDVVSWLPPKHPKGKITHSAAYLREEKALQVEEEEKHEEPRKSTVEEKDHKKHSRYKSKSKDSDLHLDPMDPAAYSDIPKGTWSSGLETKSEPKVKIPQGTLYQIKAFHTASNLKRN